MTPYLIFLILLLAVIVYLNRHIFGFGGGCDWSGSDTVEPGQPRKWLCTPHGKVVETADGAMPSVTCDQL